MKAHRTLVVSLCVLAVAGVVRAATSGFQERRTAIYTKAEADRKKLGLEDPKKLYAKYPTPEVSFKGEPARLCAGKSATVKLTGKFVPASAFLVTNDGVQVVKEKMTATSWEAELKATAGALPGEVTVEVFSPVSAASRSAKVLELGCKYQWHLELADGQVVDLATDFAAQDRHGAASWTKSGKATGTSRFGVDGSGEDFNFTRQASQEELMGSAANMSKLFESAEYKALLARQQKASEALGACKDPKTMAACMKAPGEEIRKIGEQQETLTKKYMSAGKPTFGCNQLNVKVSGTAVSGEATECGDAKPQALKGTVTVL